MEELTFKIICPACLHFTEQNWLSCKQKKRNENLVARLIIATLYGN